MQTATFRAASEALFDPGIGIVGAFDEVAVEPDAPRYRHFRARLCDVPTIGGVATSRVIDVAAPDRSDAFDAALRFGRLALLRRHV